MTLPEVDGLDNWLASREAALADLRPDNHARIVWAGGRVRRRPLALVYLHGFSASPMETAPFCHRLADALDANLYLPRLSGHGRSAEAMAEGSVDAWFEDVREALAVGRRLGERVILVGTSTGATLATLVAALEPDPAIATLILIAPNFGLVDRRSRLLGWPGAACWIPWVLGRQRVVKAESVVHARYWTLRQPTRSLIPMYELVRRVRRLPFERLPLPVFTVLCDADAVVDAAQTRALLARAPDAEIMAVPAGEGTNHVIVGDAIAPWNTDAVVAEASSFLASRGITREGLSGAVAT